MLLRKIKRKDNNQHINIEVFYRIYYYRIIDMAIESIHTYFNATDINIYKQIEQIFTNTGQNIDIIKNYPEFCKKDLIAEIRCYKKRYNNMNLNNILKNFKTMSNGVITFFPEIQTLLKLLMVSHASSCDTERSLSALRRLNTWLRNSMTHRRLNVIMI